MLDRPRAAAMACTSREYQRSAAASFLRKKPQETAARLAHAQKTGHGDTVLGSTGLTLFQNGGGCNRGHKAAIDQHDDAVGSAQRRQQPEAATEVGDGLDQRRALGEKSTGHMNMPVFIRLPRQLAPVLWSGTSERSGMHTSFDPFDQIELPVQPLDLPGAECQQRCKYHHAQYAQHYRHGSGPRFAHGILRISLMVCAASGIIPGIML